MGPMTGQLNYTPTNPNDWDIIGLSPPYTIQNALDRLANIIADWW